MEQVLLKSRIGPMTITYRPLDKMGVPQKSVFEWGFDNDFKCAVPLTWWNDVESQVMDRKTNLKYSEAFLPLRRME
jgi:hypothetical protein